MVKTKPIFIITVGHFEDEEHKQHLVKAFDRLKDDYYVFICQDNSNNAARFELFSTRKLKPINFKRLEKLIK